MMHVRVNSQFESLRFFLYFFNKYISLNIPLMLVKFGIHVYECHLEGSVSQMFYLGPSFYFMQS